MNRMHRLLAIAAAILGVAAAGADLRPGNTAAELAAHIDTERDHLSAVDLAELIMRSDPALRVLDLRSRVEFEQFHIPGAHQASIGTLAHDALPRDATIVLYSEGGAHAAQAWVLLRMRGFRRVFFLREGIYEWISRVFEPKLATDATPAERTEFERAAALSRFFGGTPRAGVPRAEVPQGYWTGAALGQSAPSTPSVIAKIRRRGC
jgi:rhodanese-related sulfurtransferase